MGLFDILKKGGGKPRITITAINVKLHGNMHGLEGFTASENPFNVEIPFRNKTHSDMLTEAADFKAQKAEPIRVNSIKVSEPFSLVSAEPNAPITIKPEEKVVFKLRINGPTHNYSGPISISLESDDPEMIHVEIKETVLKWKGRDVPIETSSRILSIPRGQIFTEKVQLYKALTFGDTVSTISIASPFMFAGSDPKLPIKVNDPNSCIVNLYIQAPQTPYAGQLEVSLE